MGDVLAQQGKYDEAMTYLRDAHERAGRNDTGKHQIAIALRLLEVEALSGLHGPDSAHTDHDISVELIEAIENNWDSAIALNQIVWYLVDTVELPMSASPLLSDELLRAVVRACELTQYKDGAILDTLARVHYLRDEIGEALRWQTEATKNMHDLDPVLREELMEHLATYEAAQKELTESPASTETP